MSNTSRPKPIVLVVLDGWGVGQPYAGNAITSAKLPNYNALLASYPHGKLLASGEAVGLPSDEQGNSEVGHINLGAGTVVYQDLPRINMSIASGEFLKNPSFLKTIAHGRENSSKLHLLGLASPANVHSSLNHLYALLWLLKENNFSNVFLHLFTDGRDSGPKYGETAILEVENHLKELGLGKIATISGRYYAMDRDNRWERTKLCYDALTLGKGLLADSAAEAVSQAYNSGETDEFIRPTVITQNSKPIATIDNNDSIICFNFRTDRTRQIIEALVLPNFEHFIPVQYEYDTNKDHYLLMKQKTHKDDHVDTFQREKVLQNISVATMTQYENDLPVNVAFAPVHVKYPLAAVISSLELRQLHISETEKYPHVTYFFNGGREQLLAGEDVLEIPSPKVATYDLKPEMSAYELTDKLIEKINTGVYDFVIVNYANPDMVGHSGNLPATIRACEVIDECLGRLQLVVQAKGGAIIIVGDHGNAELKINPDNGGVITSHTTNPVPIIIVAPKFRGNPLDLGQGILADVSPTILKIMGLPIPSDMTGRVLI